MPRTSLVYEEPMDNLVIAIDAETTGSNYNEHAVIAVGVACVCVSAHEDPRILSTRRFTSCATIKFPTDSTGSLRRAKDGGFNAPVGPIVDYGDFEPRCWDEFWCQNLHILEQLTAPNNGHPDLDEIRYYIDRICTKVHEATPTAKIIIVSDNPAFDLGRIDHEICCSIRPHHTKHGPLPLNYIFKGGTIREYNGIDSTDNFYELREAGVIKFEVPECPVEHNHLPENDATTIAWKYAHITKQLGLLKA